MAISTGMYTCPSKCDIVLYLYMMTVDCVTNVANVSLMTLDYQ